MDKELKKALQKGVEPIKEKVDWKALNKLNLVNAIFKGTDIPDLANYPKKPTKPF